MRLLGLKKCPVNIDVNLHCERCGRKRRQAMHAVCAFRHCETERCGQFMASKQAEFGHFVFRVSEDGSAPWNAARMKSMTAHRATNPSFFITNASAIVNWIVIESRSVVVLVPCCIYSAFRASPQDVGHCTAIRFQHDFVVQFLSDQQGMRSESVKLRPSVLGGCHNRFRDEVLLKSCSPNS